MEKTKTVTYPSRIALFGGSFDPVHCAHLKVAYCALEQMGLDKVIFVPASQSPLKRKPFSKDFERLEMLRLALKDEVKFELSPYEIERKELSFTINTVEHFRDNYSSARLFLIIGEDQFAQLSRWYRINDLAKKVIFLVYPRLISDDSAETPVSGLRYQRLKSEIMSENSTEIRERCQKGLPLSGRVPDLVEAFIFEQGLYKEAIKPV